MKNSLNSKIYYNGPKKNKKNWIEVLEYLHEHEYGLKRGHRWLDLDNLKFSSRNLEEDYQEMLKENGGKVPEGFLDIDMDID